MCPAVFFWSSMRGSLYHVEGLLRWGVDPRRCVFPLGWVPGYYVVRVWNRLKRSVDNQEPYGRERFVLRRGFSYFGIMLFNLALREERLPLPSPRTAETKPRILFLSMCTCVSLKPPGHYLFLQWHIFQSGYALCAISLVLFCYFGLSFILL